MSKALLERQAALIAAAYQVAEEHGCELKRHATNTTEGGARSVTVTFVLLPDGGGKQTTIEGHLDGVSGDLFDGFAAPRAHRAGAESS